MLSSPPSEELPKKGRANMTLSEMDRITVTGTRGNVHSREGESGLAGKNKCSSKALTGKMELTDE